jgi:Bacterial type II secretion system protein F domain.
VVDSGAGAGRIKLGSDVINLILRLELGTSAGLAPMRVLQWASEGDSLLAQLLKSLTREVSMGKLTHVVFTRLAEDYGIPEAREVAVSLKQAEVQGLSISSTLSDLSRDLRDSRERDAEIQIVKMRPSIEGILTATMMVAAITLMVGPLAAENIGVINHMVGAPTPYGQ